MWPRRYGKPDQTAATGLVRRPHELSSLVGQSVQDVVIGFSLHPAGVNSAAGLEEYERGPRLPGYDSADATEDRGGDLEQDPPDSFPVILCLPVSGPVQVRGGAPRTGLTWIRPCCGSVRWCCVNTHRIRLLLSSACPHQDLFRMVAVRLDTS